MPIALVITLIVVLTAIAVGLVPLLFQLRRTAQALDSFLVSSKRDLAQITEDIHASRLRMDHLAETLQASLEDLSSFTQSLGEAGRTLKNLHTRFHDALGMLTSNLGGIVGGISLVLALFKNKRNTPKTE